MTHVCHYTRHDSCVSYTGPGGQRIEVQIRTREMHRVAEEGIAAHWMYKGEHKGVEEARRFSWLRQLTEWVQELKDPQVH